MTSDNIYFPPSWRWRAGNLYETRQASRGSDAEQVNRGAPL